MTDDEKTGSPLSVRLFGPLDILIHGDPMPPLPYHKGRWVLAILVLRHGRDVDRAWLSGLLWPEMGQVQALYNLRRVLTYLRKAMGCEAARLRAPDRSSLSLDLDGAGVDLLAFDEAIERHDAASLELAVSLYRGPLLEGCTEEWVFQEREAREQAYLTALESLADRAIRQGESTIAVDYLRRVVDRDPLRESASRALMTAFAEGGDYAEMVETYRRLREELRRELSVEPSAETRELFRRLRTEGKRRTGRPAVDAPERPGGGRPACRLPRPLTALIGREREVEEIERCLESARLVTLVGPGGIGKTRLALQVAENLVELYADGVWFVDLAPVPDPNRVDHAVMTALGFRDVPGRSHTETLITALEGKSLLLLLDNCEHLAGACARLADHILRHANRVRILATSRQSFGLIGERIWRTPSLSLPDPRTLDPKGGLVTGRIGESETIIGRVNEPDVSLDRIAESEAVRLFLERARAVVPEFKLDSQNARAVGAICRRLEGLPLAIEMAAARVLVLTLGQIEDRLDEPLSLLVSRRSLDLPDARPREEAAIPAVEAGTGAFSRQRTLRAILDWSYALLSDAERRLLSGLSIFAGGFTLDLAEKVCASRVDERYANGAGKIGLREPPPSLRHSTGVMDGVESLTDKSLLQREETGTAELRFRMLEMVRQFAIGKLDSTGRREFTDRYVEVLLGLVETAESHFNGSEMEEWLDRLDRERVNLSAVLELCGIEGKRVDEGLRMAAALREYWLIRGRLTEGRETLSRLLSLPEAAKETPVRAAALIAAARLADDQWDYAAAGRYAAEGLAIARRLKDPATTVEALVASAFVAWSEGDFARAEAFGRESLDLCRSLDHRGAVAMTLFALSLAAEGKGDYLAARRFIEESLAIQRKLRNRRRIALGLNGLAESYRYAGDSETARKLYKEALEIRRELADRWGIANTLHLLGLNAIDRSDYAEAIACLRESLRIQRDLGNRAAVVLLLSELAGVAMARDRWTSAARLWGAFETMRELSPLPVPLAYSRAYEETRMATLREKLGDADFGVAYEIGRNYSWDEAIGEALSDEP